MTAIDLAVKNHLVRISLNFVGSSVTGENEKKNGRTRESKNSEKQIS